LTLQGAIIAGNSASEGGGGIYVVSRMVGICGHGERFAEAQVAGRVNAVVFVDERVDGDRQHVPRLQAFEN
jgi:predicted outer membrane repeat protein